MKRNTLILLSFCCTAMISHKFYMSLTQINYSVQQKALQITLRIFIDDLETEINALSPDKIELATDREPLDIALIYKNYLKNHLHFQINNDSKIFEYLGKEYKNDQVIFYLEIAEIDSITSLEVENTILNSSFPEQENIIKTSLYDTYKSFILTKNSPKALVAKKNTTFMNE